MNIFLIFGLVAIGYCIYQVDASCRIGGEGCAPGYCGSRGTLPCCCSGVCDVSGASAWGFCSTTRGSNYGGDIYYNQAGPVNSYEHNAQGSSQNGYGGQNFQGQNQYGGDQWPNQLEQNENGYGQGQGGYGGQYSQPGSSYGESGYGENSQGSNYGQNGYGGSKQGQGGYGAQYSQGKYRGDQEHDQDEIGQNVNTSGQNVQT